MAGGRVWLTGDGLGGRFGIFYAVGTLYAGHYARNRILVGETF